MTGVSRGDPVKARTAETFAFEWQRFGALRADWERNFLDYLRPLRARDLRGKLLLDVGAGSGRHSFHAQAAGARVVAVDIGDAIDVARRNLPDQTLTVQADLDALPFEPGTFDIVWSIGVLHHARDPEAALRRIVPLARPGGYVHAYLYWVPQRRWHRVLLTGVTFARRVTTRLPTRLLLAACHPIAAVLFVCFVAPHRAGRHRPRLRRIADSLPLKAYADYPFVVLLSDQFDRFSAPIEHRFTRGEVARMFDRVGLEEVLILENNGWVAHGRRPWRTKSAVMPAQQVSVVIPVWGDYADHRLDEALASIRAQDIESNIILVDNGNRTPLRRRGVSIVRSETQVSLGAARDLGLRSVSTPEVMFWDADDRMLPGTLARLKDRLDRDPALVACATSIIDTMTGQPLHWPRRWPLRLGRYRRLYATVNAVSSLYPVTGALVRTAFAQDAGFPDAERGDDWVMGVSLAFRGRVAVDEHPGRLYSRGPGSVSARWTRRDVVAKYRLVRERLRNDPAIPPGVVRLLPVIVLAQHVVLMVLRPLARRTPARRRARA
jgi:SAM-dependent methyltransferase